MDLPQFQRLLERKDVFGAVVPGERLTDGLRRSRTANVAVLRQLLWGTCPGDDRADDPHASHSGDVRNDVVELHVHLHERLLHVLHVRGRVLDDPLAVTQVCAESHHLVARAETSAQQAVLMELLQPLRIVHVGLSSGHVLHVARVHEKHLKPARRQDLKDRDPVHAGRLHRDRLDAHAAEPVRHPVEIAAEAPKRANGLLILIAAHRDDVKRRSDVQPGRVLIEREQLSRRSSARLLLFALHGGTSVGEARSRGGGRADHFPNRDRLDGVANIKSASHPRTMFFYGFAEHQKVDGHSSRRAMVGTPEVSRRAGARLGRARPFFWTSTSASACSARLFHRPTSRSSSAIRLSRESGGVTFGPRFFGDNPASSPRSRAARQVVNSDEYSPSRRSRAPISPGFVHRSASRTIRRLYSAVNRRRSALATTSTWGRPAPPSPAP